MGLSVLDYGQRMGKIMIRQGERGFSRLHPLLVNLDFQSVIHTNFFIIYSKLPLIISFKSRDSSVGVVTRLRAGRSGFRVRFSAGAANCFLHHRDQNCSGVHSASYPMGTRSSSPGGKAARA
jgi:hypothetical protein